jgi:hypothetical protein
MDTEETRHTIGDSATKLRLLEPAGRASRRSAAERVSPFFRIGAQLGAASTRPTAPEIAWTRVLLRRAGGLPVSGADLLAAIVPASRRW